MPEVLPFIDEKVKTVNRNYRLFQNIPNPVNVKVPCPYGLISSTLIVFELPQSEFVTLKIYNVDGTEVATILAAECQAGTHAYRWNAAGQPDGLYYYRLQAGAFVETKSFILLS